MSGTATVVREQLEFDLAKPVNLFEYLKVHITDEGFEPGKSPRSTSLKPGPDKVEVMANRVKRSESLWHEDDPVVEEEATEYDKLIGRANE